MKLPIKSALCCALCIAAGTTFGQSSTMGTSTTTSDNDRDVVRSSDTATSSEVKAGESTKFFKSKDLVGADIKDSAGNKLGDISELLVNHSTGETFASVGVSGNRHALVPIQAFQVTRPAGMLRNAVVTLNSTKQNLESGPTIGKDEWNRLDTPTFVQSIYSHYRLQQPTAMGGSDSSLGGTSSGTDLRHDKKYDKDDDNKVHNTDDK